MNNNNNYNNSNHQANPNPHCSLPETNAFSAKPLRVCILGASGSIGTQALQVAREHPGKIDIIGLSVHRATDFLANAAKEFRPEVVCVSDEEHLMDEALKVLDPSTTILAGEKGLEKLAKLPEADCILIAVVGAAGIKATHAAVVSGKRVALANKESLVAAGDLLIPLAKPGQIIPVDSEHSAIFQCLMGEKTPLETIWLTCSGGPFYGFTKEQLEHVNAKDALKHPSWSMGPKITIDSATLANKGLEVIEAHHLFGTDYDQIKVLIQPGSTIHSMVSFRDGSTKAQLAAPSMRTPISLAFSYPQRWSVSDTYVDYQKQEPLRFGAPDLSLFRCLDLAIQAGKEGGIMPAVMNAANEVANIAFREGKISFLAIPSIIEKTMNQTQNAPLKDFEQLEEADLNARERTGSLIK